MNTLVKGFRQLMGRPPKGELSFTTVGEKTCGLEFEQIREVMEWLAKSLFVAGYRGRAQAIWYADDQEDTSYSDGLKRSLKSGKPTFMYRCGQNRLPLPEGYYWRLMMEHRSQRVYQLEKKE